MAVFVWALAAVLGRAVAVFESQTCSYQRMATIEPGAEAMIGGIIAMHEEGTNGYGCGISTTSMQSYEALRYTLDLLNKKNEFLNGEYLTDYYVPGIRLGMQVIDYCSQKGTAVAAVTSLFPTLGSDMRSCMQHSNLTLGIIGTSDSGATEDIATFSDRFQIPVVSFMSTARELTFSGKHKNFMRTIPPDDELMEAMGQLLTKLRWSYIVVVLEDTAYSQEAFKALRPVLAKEGICLTAVFEADPTDTTTSTVQSLLEKVIATDTVGTIFLGGTPLATALLRLGNQVSGAGKLQWIFTDSISLDASFSFSYPRGIISVLSASRFIVEFEDHWVRIDEENPSPENPWFQQWYAQTYQCNLGSISSYSRPCTALFPGNNAIEKERQKRLVFVQDQFVEPAVHAVFTYAYALREAQTAKCGLNSSGICPNLAAMTHEEFLNSYLKKVDFTYTTRERVSSLPSDQYAPYKAAKRLKFDSRGDIIGPSFSVWNYNDAPIGEENSTSFKFREVGNYINGLLTLRTEYTHMYTEDRLARLLSLPPSPCPANGCFPCLGLPEEMKYYYRPGDIVINGIFSLHNMGRFKFSCGELISNVHPLYLEAMIYAVKQVNNLGILGGVTLGGLGIDDCMDSDLSTNFIMQVQKGMYKVEDQAGNQLDPHTVEAYTGAYNTSLTIPLAEVMDDIFMQPMVGYRANSAKLDRYQYYLKTVPSLEEEFRAIVMIMKNYTWNYTQVLYSTDAYNADDIVLFRRIAAEAGICVVASYNFEPNHTMATEQLRYHPTVRPIVLLLSTANHLEFLKVLNSTGRRRENDFIASSTLGNNAQVTKGLENIADGFISINFVHSNLTQFYNDLASHRVNSYQENPWFEEWFEASFNCYIRDNPRGYNMPCNTSIAASSITSAPGFIRDLTVVHVINAVYAIARGLSSVLTKYCNSAQLCPAFLMASRSNKGMDLRDEILKVTFSVEDSSPVQEFKFSGHSGTFTYTIYNFQMNQFVAVGTVNPATYSMTSLPTANRASSFLPYCPRPCAECTYMFAFQKYWYLDGDLIIPAVFDVHYKGDSVYNCGLLRQTNGVQYPEAFKYALDFVNQGNTGIKLNGVRLGGLAFDGCTSSNRSTSIINGVMGRTFPIMDNSGNKVDISKFVSWLTYDSETTMEAADMLKMIGMPLVSPGATAPQLLNKTMYSTFFRTIPSDTVIAKAMAEFIQNRGWNYVITLNAPDDGSRNTRDKFREYLKDFGICVIASYEFETDGSVKTILDSIQLSSTQVVVVFADPDRNIPEMLKYKQGLSPDPRIIFISNRFWDLNHMGLGPSTVGLPFTAVDSISFRLENSAVADFLTYLRGLTLSASTNPWLPEYFQALFMCDLGSSHVYGTNCQNPSMSLSAAGTNVYQHMYTLTTINAVHALAVGLDMVLMEKCGAAYTGVCSRFMTDSDTLDRLMIAMDRENFTDVTSMLFTFLEREANRGFEVLQHKSVNQANMIATVSVTGNLTYQTWDSSVYSNIQSECPGNCIVCEDSDGDLSFSFIAGEVYIVGLFDVHMEGTTPFTCGSINKEQGLPLLEAFNFAIDYINQNFDFRGVKVGGIGFDVCRNPTRAANIVANIHNGNFVIKTRGGVPIANRSILAYVGPFDTQTTIRVADILSAIGIPQVTYGASGLQLQDPIQYGYLLRSVPADDKQSRAIISYLKNFNLTNIQVVTSNETIGQTMTQEFMRLASLNLICIHHHYTVGNTLDRNITSQAKEVVENIVRIQQSKVVILLVDNPLPILKAAGANDVAREEILWVATDKWGYNKAYLEDLAELLGDRSSKKNVIIFDIETADVPLFDSYLDGKTPYNYTDRDPWFAEYYEDFFSCSVQGTGTVCDPSRSLPRAAEYIQDPYVLYVVNAVFSAGKAIRETVNSICWQDGTWGTSGLCVKFLATGDRRDIVLRELRSVNFTDDTLQPFYFEPTGESSRGYHIYNVTNNIDDQSMEYMYENVGSYNDTHFLKLDITYDVSYEAYCKPYESCDCVNPFPERIDSRYMLEPSPFQLNLVYIGDIHEPHPSDPFSCSNIKVGADFFKMMAFFYAIHRVNANLDKSYPDSLRLGGIALDTCSSTLRLDQDIFNLVSGFPLCDTGKTGQVIPPSSIIAFVPEGNANSVPVSQILASTGITSVSPSATTPKLREYIMSEHFLSIVPPDDVQANVLLELMARLNWDYVSVIYSEEPNRMAAKDEFLRQTAVSKRACVGQAVPLKLTADVNDAEKVLDQVSRQVGARVIVLFTLPQHTKLLLQAAKNRGQTGRFTWLITSGWDQNKDALRGLEQQASGAIVLQPYSLFLEDFVQFIKMLTFNNRQGIPDDWFEEIYQTLHSCKIPEARKSLPFSRVCSKTEVITDNMVPQDPSLLHTVIAVFMVAQGLKQIPSCIGSSLDVSACITSLQNRDTAIYQSTLGAQWNVLPELLGNNSFSFTFNPAGYGNIGFDILNYRSTSSGFGYSRLGRYQDSLDINTQLYQGSSLYENAIAISNCLGTECICHGPTGIYGVPSAWMYYPQEASVIVNEEGRSYRDPATGALYYVEKIPDVISRFRDMWGVAVATLAAIGVAVSLALFIYLLVVYPVRMGTSVLGYMLSFGIILLYGLVFAFVAHVNVELCGLRRFCLGFCYAICYSTLFVKLVDCWRSRKKEDMFEVKYNKLGRPLGLFMVAVLLVLVQVIINAEWLILVEPKVVRIFYNNQYWPRCTPNNFYDEGLILSLCYVMVLIFLIVLLGFCSFNSKKNHRESRWILGMGILSVPIWVVWCTWSIMGEMKTRDAAVAIGLLVNATVLLLLGPVRKLYLLNKYQAMEEEERKLQLEQNNKATDYSVYGHQYDNVPQLHDRASAVGSARGHFYRYPPSSSGHSRR